MSLGLNSTLNRTQVSLRNVTLVLTRSVTQPWTWCEHFEHQLGQEQTTRSNSLQSEYSTNSPFNCIFFGITSQWKIWHQRNMLIDLQFYYNVWVTEQNVSIPKLWFRTGSGPDICSHPAFERMGYSGSGCHFVLRCLSFLHRSSISGIDWMGASLNFTMFIFWL